MKRRPLLLAAFGTALVLGASAAGAPTWGAPVRLSSGDRALGPELAGSPAGDAAVVWDQEVGPDCANSPASLTCVHIVELTTRKRGTSVWQSPVELARPGIGDRPRVAINDAGDAVVAWVHDIGRDRVLQATYRSRSSSTFPEPSDVSEPSLGVQDFRIGVDRDGNAVAVWAERKETGISLRAAARSATTGAWGAAKTLSLPGEDVSGGPSLAVTPDSVAVVAWIESGVVREIRGDVRTGSWGGPVLLSNGIEDAIGTPGISIDETTQDTIVVWASRTAPDVCCHVQAAFSSAGGGSEPQELGDLRSSFESPPRVGIDGNGNALAIWVSPRGLESAARPRTTGAWSSPSLVSARSSTVGDPELAIDPRGNAVAVWTSGANGMVQAAVRPGESGEWQPPVDVSVSGSSTPRVSMDADGNAVAVWNEASSQPAVVESAELAGTGPILSHLTTPKRAIVVGARARFSVRPVPWASPLASEPVWLFGDGSSARGLVVAHAYARTARYRVSVSQADAAGGVSTAMATVKVIGARLRNRRAPSIRGTPRVGSTLTCLRGAWTGSPPIHYAYSWRRDGTPIRGATRPRYRLVQRDAGSLIACEVVASNPAGSVDLASAVVGVKR